MDRAMTLAIILSAATAAVIVTPCVYLATALAIRWSEKHEKTSPFDEDGTLHLTEDEAAKLYRALSEYFDDPHRQARLMWDELGDIEP